MGEGGRTVMFPLHRKNTSYAVFCFPRSCLAHHWTQVYLFGFLTWSFLSKKNFRIYRVLLFSLAEDYFSLFIKDIFVRIFFNLSFLRVTKVQDYISLKEKIKFLSCTNSPNFWNNQCKVFLNRYSAEQQLLDFTDYVTEADYFLRDKAYFQDSKP